MQRHADHDPDLICRPAFGYGLCEPLSAELSAQIREALAATERGETVDLGDFTQYADDDPDSCLCLCILGNDMACTVTSVQGCPIHGHVESTATVTNRQET
jgi:hypothetical protein